MNYWFFKFINYIFKEITLKEKTLFSLQKCKETPENTCKKVHYMCSENLKIFCSRLF